MKFIFLFPFLLALLSLYKPHNSNQAIKGTVRDAMTNTPLAGAAIQAKSGATILATTQTDKTGAFKLSIAPGRYTLECSLPGYKSVRYIDVTVTKDTPTNMDIPLAKTGGLEEWEVLSYSGAPDKNGAYRDDVPGGRGEGRIAATGKGMAKSKAAPAEYKSVAAKPAMSAEPVMDREVITESVVMEDGPKTSYTEDAKRKKDDTPPSPSTRSVPNPRAGLLTAGEWNDLHNWAHHWVDLQQDGELTAHERTYNFYPKHRYTVLLANQQDFPLVDVPVKLYAADNTLLWEARTDNTGKAELWAGMFDQKAPGTVHAIAILKGEPTPLGTLKSAEGGFNRFVLDQDCSAPSAVDIVWAVDATGSMGDEIEYLKTELLDVIGRAQARNRSLTYRMGTVFYRDKGDEYITRSSGLSTDMRTTVDFIRNQYAGGGGDYPEAVHTALEEVVNSQPWSENAVARICFLVLDASPHQDAAVNASLERSIREAAKKGIRIVPVTASGIQKDTEFLMKFFGLATNGTYVFLTDHSGIGGKHLEPTSEEYKVELLNNLLVRLITEYTTLKTCEGQSVVRFETPEDPQQQQTTPWEARYFPNPANVSFTLDLPVDVQSVILYNSEGKVVRKMEKVPASMQTIVVQDLPEGFYTLRIQKDDTVQSGKVVVIHQ